MGRYQERIVPWHRYAATVQAVKAIVYGCDSWKAWTKEVWYDSSGSVNTYYLESLPQVNSKVTVSDTSVSLVYVGLE